MEKDKNFVNMTKCHRIDHFKQNIEFLKRSKWMILYVIIIVIYFRWRGPSFPEALVAIVIGAVSLEYVQRSTLSVRNMIYSSLMFTAFYWGIRWFGSYGIYGSLLALLIITARLLWIGRKSVVQAWENIETSLFGKPLKRDNWKNQEVKFKWQRKKKKK